MTARATFPEGALDAPGWRWAGQYFADAGQVGYTTVHALWSGLVDGDVKLAARHLHQGHCRPGDHEYLAACGARVIDNHRRIVAATSEGPVCAECLEALAIMAEVAS